MCHQILDQQRFDKDPSLAHPAARYEASSRPLLESLRMDVEQLGGFRSVEGAGAHGGDQVEYAPSWNLSGISRMSETLKP